MFLLQQILDYGYAAGNNANSGTSLSAPVATLANAYSKLPSGGTTETNIIVVLGTLTDNTYINSSTLTNQQLTNHRNPTYDREATLTGAYGGVNYNGVLPFSGGRFLSRATEFHHLSLNGAGTPAETYFYLQGENMTFGEGVTMSGYATISGFADGGMSANTASFHLIAGFQIPANINQNSNLDGLSAHGAKVVIRSGTFARVVAGSRVEAGSTTAGYVLGKINTYTMSITVDIRNSTTNVAHGFDVNLIVGGQTDGSMYSDVTINIKNGKVGRVVGANVAYGRTSSAAIPSNTVFGDITINISGGTVEEMYGGGLGRFAATGQGLTEVYFYGIININISGGVINSQVYGAGAARSDGL